MVREKTLNFLAPSLHPNTLLDLSFSEPKIGPSAPPSEVIVNHLPIKYGDHRPVGGVRRMIRTGENQVVVADDKFQVSTLNLTPLGSETAAPPLVISQESVKGRSKDTWAGLVPLENGTVSALTSGLLTYHPFTSKSEPSSSSSSRSRTVLSPLACLASTPLDPTSFALGGKEVDVSLYDVERTFGSGGAGGDTEMKEENGKRKKSGLEPGQIWQAKNVPNNSLALRQPIYHLSLAYLPSSSNLLVSGTKMGTVRRFDTRQRKPLSDWKVAKEGGVGCVAPGVEHELFFSDRSNLLGSLDMRTGKVLYSYSALTSTPQHLLPLPTFDTTVTPTPGTRRIGLATICSDATFRIHTTSTPPELQGVKGNWGEGNAKKGEVVGMIGGAGVGEGIFRGWGEREVVVEKKERGEGEGDENEDDNEDEEEVWDGMEEFEDAGEEESDEEDGDVEEHPEKPLKKKTRKI